MELSYGNSPCVIARLSGGDSTNVDTATVIANNEAPNCISKRPNKDKKTKRRTFFIIQGLFNVLQQFSNRNKLRLFFLYHDQ